MAAGTRAEILKLAPALPDALAPTRTGLMPSTASLAASSQPSTSPLGQWLIAIDCASVAAVHQPQDSGFLNIEAVELALHAMYERGHSCVCLVPPIWMAHAIPGVGGDEATVASKRRRLVRMIEAGEAVVVDDSPTAIVEWCLKQHRDTRASDTRARQAGGVEPSDSPGLVVCVLGSRSKYTDAAIRSFGPEQQRAAMRKWLGNAVWEFSFEMGPSAQKRFVPKDTFESTFSWQVY